MKIKIKMLPVYAIIFFMILGVGLLKPFTGSLSFGKTDYIIMETGIFSIILCSIYLIRYRPKWDMIYAYLLIALIVLIVGVHTSVRAGKNVFSYDVRMPVYKYSYIFLAFPIYQLLSREIWEFKRFLNLIVNVTILSILIRTIISVIQKFTGVIIFSEIATEYAAAGWIRNGWLRVNPPAFSVIIIPILMYLYYESKEEKRKKYLIYAAYVIAYSMIIHGARSVTIYQIIELVFMVLYKRKGTKKQMLLFACIATSCICFINSSVGNNFINSFSTGGDAGSTTGRVEALAYYTSMIRQHFWTGTGFLSFAERQFTGKAGYIVATLGDIGILYSFVQVGVTIIVFYLLYIVRSLYVGQKIKKRDKDSNLYLLVYGNMLAVILTIINIDMFFGIYLLAVPFCIAIVEYASKQVPYMCELPR